MSVTQLPHGFTAVPYDAVTLSGLPLQTLLDVASDTAGFALIAPNGRAVDGEDGRRPFRYQSLDQCRSDVALFAKVGGCSTCGGYAWQCKPERGAL